MTQFATERSQLADVDGSRGKIYSKNSKVKNINAYIEMFEKIEQVTLTFLLIIMACLISAIAGWFFGFGVVAPSTSLVAAVIATSMIVFVI